MGKRIFNVLAALGLFALPAASPGAAAEAGKRLPESRTQVELSFAPLVRKAAPAVVNIYTSKTVQARRVSPLFDDPFFRRFFGQSFGFGSQAPRKRVQNSLGSGVIVRPEGLIVTNNHVIEGADQITVVLADRREFEAAVVGSDERADLAVLKIEAGADKLPFLELRDSDELEVGDLVLAIGNPFGVGQTVTSGIISALARTQGGISDLNFFIQTDAAINPGNSGGALVGMDGRMVGINSAIYSKSGGSLGIGFAIPSNMVATVIAGVVGGGRLVRPWLGAWGQAVSADIAASFDMPRPAGVLVNRVYPGGPAGRAGVSVGDVLLEVEGREVNDPDALNYRLATLKLGGKAELTLWRRGVRKLIRLALEAPPEEPPRDITELGGPHPLSGATVANMSPALADELDLDAFAPGVYVLGVRRGSPARRLRFRTGDRIEEINGRGVDTVAALKDLLDRRTDRWNIAIMRNGKTLKLRVDR